MRKYLKLHHVSPFFCLAAAELFIYIVAAYIGLAASYAGITNFGETILEFRPEVSLFASVLMISEFAVGLYRWEDALDFRNVFERLVISFLMGFLLLTLVFYAFPSLRIWRSAIAVSIPVAFAAILGVRYAFLRMPKLGIFRRRILVVGVSERAARIETLERRGRASRFECVAFMDVTGEERKVSPFRVLPAVNTLPEFIERHAIDEIVVAASNRRGCLPLETLIDCRLTGTPIQTYQSFMEREVGRIDLDALSPDWFLFSRGFSGGWLQKGLKRALDVMVSAVLITLLAPLMIAVAIAIRLDSEGPILYRQERLGYKGKSFVLLKFRSMSVNAEKDGVPRWAQHHDDRITKVGRLIRKTRIDELPQLFNVLKGEMSLVGPRPERPFFVEQISQAVPYYRERHRVKPGMTGWAQLNYPYGASIEDAKGKLQYDLYYVKYYNLVADLLIIMQTLRVVLWPQGVR